MGRVNRVLSTEAKAPRRADAVPYQPGVSGISSLPVPTQVTTGPASSATSEAAVAQVRAGFSEVLLGWTFAPIPPVNIQLHERLAPLQVWLSDSESLVSWSVVLDMSIWNEEESSTGSMISGEETVRMNVDLPLRNGQCFAHVQDVPVPRRLVEPTMRQIAELMAEVGLEWAELVKPEGMEDLQFWAWQREDGVRIALNAVYMGRRGNSMVCIEAPKRALGVVVGEVRGHPFAACMRFASTNSNGSGQASSVTPPSPSPVSAMAFALGQLALV